MNLDDRGARTLVSRIIVQAVIDWYCCEDAIRNGATVVQFRRDHAVSDAIETRNEIEGFFFSSWFSTLSDLDGPALVSLMRSGPVYFFHGASAYTGKAVISKRTASWRRLYGFPELQERLWANDIMQNDIAVEIGISNFTLSDWLRNIDEAHAVLIRTAADSIIRKNRA